VQDHLNSKRVAKLFIAGCHEWETPNELFAELNAEFGFEIDVCATAATAKCAHFFSPDQDGLRQPWHGVFDRHSRRLWNDGIGKG
jgi:hypothetical protein